MFLRSLLKTWTLLLLPSLLSHARVGFSNMADSPPVNPNATKSATSTPSDSQSQYDALIKVLPGKVSLPLDPTYQSSKTSYFSQQEEQVSPACIVTPKNTNDVAAAVKALASLYESSPSSSQFAVRGGGHTPWAGSASIEGGAVIDMTSIRAVTVNADQTVTSVGGGATWSDVYSYLDLKNLAVSGGRAAQVGVAGLTLGGDFESLKMPLC